ncbi:CBS domain-containing protein [Metallosphaera tengchongensis]|uniref:CBS domain-containing protein n=1 Tax=Metallosphaera tengchongensis TaxID=1532350 RepID=A0A6N0NXV2_9CREN|nr:CBS domain-containing protein [Metallosphaera tengchongensis]QKR00419.1 CBS domain-containing protein [Metallosphaera tengchongensis]
MSHTVSQIATKVIHVIKEDDSVVSAASEMKNHNMGSMIVVDSNNQVVGIITERDMVRALADRKIDAKVRDYMTASVKGVTEETTIEDALEIMLENGFRHLPVIGKNGKILGIVSIRDIARALSDSHFLQYGKDWTEVKGSGVVCPVCGLEIDETGYCNCGTGSS